jgi:hypothetical protein
MTCIGPHLPQEYYGPALQHVAGLVTIYSRRRSQMTAASLVSLVGAVISAVGALVAVLLNRRAVMRDRRLTADELAGHYRVPMLHAAFNLQSRLYNIGRQDFLGIFLTGGSSSEAEYARFNTVYLIGQYLCWAEILRREAQLLAPLHRGRDRDIVAAMEGVRFEMADSMSNSDPVLRIFRGDQRAIGEVMLTTTNQPADRIGPRWDCVGYAAFVQALGDEQTTIYRWIQPLLQDIDELAKNYHAHQVRVIAIQHHLVGLISLIDPEGDRIPVNQREKMLLAHTAYLTSLGCGGRATGGLAAWSLHAWGDSRSGNLDPARRLVTR